MMAVQYVRYPGTCDDGIAGAGEVERGASMRV